MNSNIPDTYLAWLAGFIDGEGSLIFGFSFKKTHSHRWNIHFNAVLSIPQRSDRRKLLDDIAEITGVGRVHGKSLGAAQSSYLGESGYTCKGMTQYVCNARSELPDLLTALLPYLRLKKPQAEEVLRVLGILSTAMARKVNLSIGERRLTETEAVELAHVSVTLNSRSTSNQVGHKLEFLLERIKEVYSQKLTDPKNPEVEICCKWCEKKVLRKKSLIRGDVFCSPECWRGFETKRASDTYYAIFSCCNCKKEFKRKKSSAKERMYCSPECFRSWARANLSKK